MKKYKQTLTSTSVHESAHFVLTKILRPTDIQLSITIKKNEDNLGSVLSESIYGQSGISHEDIENAIATLYAGYIAEIIICKTPASLARKGAVADFEAISVLLSLTDLTTKQLNKLKARVRSRTWRLILKHHKAITSLAKALRTQKTIDGDEADLIVAAALGEKDAAPALAHLRAFKTSR